MEEERYLTELNLVLTVDICQFFICTRLFFIALFVNSKILEITYMCISKENEAAIYLLVWKTVQDVVGGKIVQHTE